MCLDGLREEAMSIPFNMSASRGWKSEAGINSFYLDTPRNWAYYPAPLVCHYKNFIWEHKIYYCTCKSICLISHQRTDPTVEYSLKNGAAVKQLPLAIRTKIHSFNIRLWDSEKNSQKAKLFFKKAIYKQVCLQLRGQNKGRISPILET